jgi:hypothetical protein
MFMVPNRGWVIPLVLVLSLACAAKDRLSGGTLIVELPAPFDTATQVVSEIAADGTIRGTGEYKTESEITGALPAQYSALLTPVVPSGAAVFYKIRSSALAPRHYDNSSDMGTIVVAYTVERVSAEKSRLTIESVFVPDSRHGRNGSDGAVESCEFTAIEAKLQALAKVKEEASQKAAQEQQQVRIITLRRQLADGQSRFDALNAEVQQLEKRSAELRQLSVVRIKSSAARLKSFPYARASVLRPLSEGEELDVLYRTASWYRVRTNEGSVGWVYYSFLEPAQ